MRTSSPLAAMLFLGSAVAMGASDCLKDPSDPTCVDAVYPATQAAIDAKMLCDAMPYMIGCNIWEHCKAGRASGKYCTDFSVVMDICFKDRRMETMRGCEGSRTFCGAKSVVKQCKENGYLPNIMQTISSITDAQNQCDANPKLPGCTFDPKCPHDVECDDFLTVIALNCGTDRSMEGCKEWNAMCKDIPPELSIICTTSAATPSAPTSAPTAAPTAAPTSAPTAAPTSAPTAAPTSAPTAAPTSAPTAAPTSAPTAAPTSTQTAVPSTAPTSTQTAAPSSTPSVAPAATPSRSPSNSSTPSMVTVPTSTSKAC